MEPTRREFVGVALAPLMGLTLAAPLPARDVTPDGALACRWVDFDDKISRLIVVRGDGAEATMLELVLFQRSQFTAPDLWTCRCGRAYCDMQAPTRADAKKMAEQKLVEWVRAILVEVERTAFSLKRRS